MEDHGDPARSEFIHLQLLLAGMGPDDERRPEAEARQTKLQKANDRRWLGALREQVVHWRFERGFVHHLALHAASLLREHPLIERSVPLDSVRLVAAQERGILAKVAALPLLARLRSST